MIRKMSVAGSFYPDSKLELQKYFANFIKLYDDSKLPIAHPKAIISPHAGYVYSGFTADVAYRVLRNSTPQTTIVVGPSHRIGFEGISLGDFQCYQTPLGEIESDLDFANELRQKFGFQFLKEAHFEHSTETQFPFVKQYLPKTKIVELVYSKTSVNFLSEILNFMLEKKDCAVIISTDLSHFYNLKDANTLDKICLQAISALDENSLDYGCEACGKVGVKAIVKSAKKIGLKSYLLDYRTSAEASLDENRVVGYMSAYFE